MYENILLRRMSDDVTQKALNFFYLQVNYNNSFDSTLMKIIMLDNFCKTFNF